MAEIDKVVVEDMETTFDRREVEVLNVVNEELDAEGVERL